jgi:NADPH:quinone reductase-like Zn-dependent oxidoreductase
VFGRFGRFGGPDVLHESEVDVPEPGPGQVRLRVRAAGVNPIDGKLRQGLLEAMFPIPLPAIPGVEAAGTVDAVGKGVTASPSATTCSAGPRSAPTPDTR